MLNGSLELVSFRSVIHLMAVYLRRGEDVVNVLHRSQGHPQRSNLGLLGFGMWMIGPAALRRAMNHVLRLEGGHVRH